MVYNTKYLHKYSKNIKTDHLKNDYYLPFIIIHEYFWLIKVT